MRKECRILDKTSGENFDGVLDTELEGNPQYPYTEIKDYVVGNKYIWRDGEVIVFDFMEIPNKKDEAHKINKEKHIEFLNELFGIYVKRDIITETIVEPSEPNVPDSEPIEKTIEVQRPDLFLVLNGTDDTRFNIQSAHEVAKEIGSVYFYDGMGKGDTLSLNEIKQVLQKFYLRVDPSFKIKGTTRFSINNANTVEEIDNIILNINYSILNKGDGNV